MEISVVLFQSKRRALRHQNQTIAPQDRIQSFKRTFYGKNHNWVGEVVGKHVIYKLKNAQHIQNISGEDGHRISKLSVV
jgi:hypothetical protein